jgi:uncharacterized membrane protein
MIEDMKMKKLMIILLAMSAINFSGCAGMSDTQQRATTGGLGGAATGAAIGAIAGNAGMGAAIGAASGLVGGYLFGKHKESEQQAYEQGRRDAQSGR